MKPVMWEAPLESFWRDDVELRDYREIMERSVDPDFLRNRLKKFSGRMLAVVAGCVGLDKDAKPADLRATLLASPQDVLPFVLAQAAGAFKATVAIEWLARRELTPTELEPFLLRSGSPQQLAKIQREQQDAMQSGLPDRDRRPEVEAILRQIDARAEGRVIARRGWRPVEKPVAATAPAGPTSGVAIAQDVSAGDRPRCRVPGCTATDGIWNGDECDHHRRERLDREAAAVGMARCLFLKQRPSEWLAKYGSEVGCDRWISSQREDRFDAGKTDAQLRRRWRAIEQRTRRDAWGEGWYCARGHDDTPRSRRDRSGEATYQSITYTTRDDLGPVGIDERGIAIARSPLYCVHQRVCRDYMGTGAALVQLAQRPQGTA